MNDTTAPEVKILVRVVSSCPVCRKTLEAQRLISDETLFVNMTDYVATVVGEARAVVQADAKRRGWTEEMCGACRDKDDDED